MKTPKRPVESFYSNCKKGYRSKYFVKGPLPWEWLMAASKAHPRGVNIAIAICLHRGLKGTLPFKLPTSATEDLSISRWTRGRTLKRLEAVGLIKVKRRKGRCPEIIAINPPNESKSAEDGM